MKQTFYIALVGLALVISTSCGNATNKQNPVQKAIDSVFPELPYAYNALEPTIDAKTMEIHYSKHHKAYYTNFLAAIKETPSATLDIVSLFAEISKQPVAVRNNGAGYYNHMLF